MSTRSPLARRVIAALLLVLLTACQTWQPITVSPQGWTPEEQPSSVRATLTRGETITIWEPTMRKDSIVGARDFSGAAAVALRDVRLLEVQRLSVRKAVGIGLSVAPLVALWVFFISERAQQRGIGP